MKTHELKTWPGVFEVMWLGRKAFELRRNDRDFAEGDVLRLREWSEEDCYTGRELLAKVSFVLQNVPEWGLKPGFCIMALHDLRRTRSKP